MVKKKKTEYILSFFLGVIPRLVRKVHLTSNGLSQYRASLQRLQEMVVFLSELQFSKTKTNYKA